MATYNWSYKPNVPNKYGIVIADSADDVRPSNACYVALFGNDVLGNGSRLKPYKTIRKAVANHGIYDIRYILASGVYRETLIGLTSGFGVTLLLIGDGDVIIDYSYFLTSFGDNYGDSLANFFNLKLISSKLDIFYNYDGGSPGSGLYARDCVFEMIFLRYGQRHDIRNCVFKDCEAIHMSQRNNYFNNTFINCKYIWLQNPWRSEGQSYTNNIFYNSNLIFNIGNGSDFTRLRLSIFYHCNFKVGGDAYHANEGVTMPKLYPALQDGFSYIDNYPDLTIFFESNGLAISKDMSLIIDPKFNNPTIGDYSLAINSPAKNMSYFGTYIGAQSIGYPIKANAAGGDFDLSTNTNLIFSDNSIVLANPTSEGSIESNVLANIVGRELANAPVFGFYADRNGQYLDATEDLSTATISASANLISNTPYLVENAAITYNGAVIQPGERFTTTDVLSFASASNGSCREILEAPQRHTILARFSDGGTVLTSGTALAVGAWYYANGPVNYEGVAYTNQVFKAISTNPFTGSGNVILAMADEAYQLYEPGIKFTSNNAGNTRTGTIIRGNGDPLYERGLEKEFPINAKFIQFRYIIKVNNLRP